MSNGIINKPPTWFWVVAVLALLWNLIGIVFYIGDAMMTPEMLATLSDAQQADYASRPAWYTAAFAFAVFGGALGSIFLLMRKKWAIWAFAVSLLGVLAQQVYHFGISTSAPTTAGAFALVGLVVVIAFVLLWFANHAAKQGWLR